jgi:salicylate hydroxylase
VVPIASLRQPWPYPSYGVLWFAPDRHFLVYPISNGFSLNIVAFVTKREDEIPDLQESWTSVCPRVELEKDYEGFDDRVQEIIRLLGDTVSKWRINDRDPLETWCFMEGKVALVGDAAHAMCPHQGAGAGQAIEDGYILARALAHFLKGKSGGAKLAVGEPPSLEECMLLYQRVRLPRAQMVQKTSREAGDLYQLQLPEFEGMSYDECVPLVVDKAKTRMKWIWGEDLGSAFEKTRDELFLGR